MSVRGTTCGPASGFGSGGEVITLLRHLLDDLDHLVGGVSVMPSKALAVTGLFEHRTTVGCAAGDGHPSATSELDQPLVAKGPQCSQHGVVIHTQYSSEISCWRKTLTRLSITLSDGSSYLGSHMLIERRTVRRIDLRVEHDATECSPIISRYQSARPAFSGDRPQGVGPNPRGHELQVPVNERFAQEVTVLSVRRCGADKSREGVHSCTLPRPPLGLVPETGDLSSPTGPSMTQAARPLTSAVGATQASRIC
jgi:hypothetical protein